MKTESVNIFANLIAGRGRGKAIARRLSARLEADGYAVRTWFDPPAELTAQAASGDARAAIIVGGDGTLRAVTQRLLALRGDLPPLLPVPLGTANLMARHLGYKWDDDSLEPGVSDAIARLRIKTLDVGTANGQIFLLIAGIGFDASVVHELEKMRTGPINYLSYLKPAAFALRDYTFPAVRVMVDGSVVWRSRPAVVFVGNVKEYGAGICVLPFARADDGLLDVCIMPCENRFELVHWFMQAALEQHVWSDKIRYLNGKHVVIEAKEPVPVQLDGDAAGHTPLDIRLLTARAPFIVPGA